MKDIKVLVLGDVVRCASCEYMEKNLWKYRKENDIDFVVVNGENSSGSGGIDKRSAETLLSAGADILTTKTNIFCVRQTIRTNFPDSDIRFSTLRERLFL